MTNEIVWEPAELIKQDPAQERRSRGRKPKLSKGQIEEIARQYADGLTLGELAENYGVSAATVSNYLRKAGVVTRGRGPGKNKDGGDS